MNRQYRRIAGPTGFGWVRSLLAFRHRNPVARFVSALLAFAMATLLVVGTGAAYADDSTPTDPAAASTDTSATDTAAGDSTPAPDTSTDPAATDTTPSGDTTTAPSSEPTTGPTRGVTKLSTTSTVKKVSSNAAPVDVTVPCGDSDANQLVGGFEIDGDLCVNHSGEDWDGLDFTTAAADYQVDGFDDNTTFTNGDSENNDPSTWHINGPTPNGKSDIGTAYAYSKVVGGDVFGFFAFTNTSTAGGTQQYDVEYNKNDATLNPNGALVPVRSPGDLLFRFSSTGNAPLTFTDAKIYTLQSSGSWDGAKCFTVTSSSPAGGWCTLTIPPNSYKADSSDDGLFQEGSIKISAFFGAGTCSGVFATTQLRSVTGNSFATSALKDYVHPLGVNTPSTCGALTINKVDKVTNAAIGGAVFSIVDDPRPGKTGTLCVYDGPDGSKPSKPAGCGDYYGDGTADGSITINPVEPGTYTVKELVAPSGYLLPLSPNDSKSVTVGQSETKSLTFEDLKQWSPLTATKTATATYGVQYAWDIKKSVGAVGGPYNDSSYEQDVPAPGSGDPSAEFEYQVIASQTGATKSDYQVNGSIKVSNPNGSPVTVNLADSLSDATSCTITGGASKVVPANAVDQAYTYSCSYGSGAPASNTGTNTATVSWSKTAYPQSWADYNAGGNYTVSPTAPYTFAADPNKVVDKVVNVTDDHNAAWDSTPWTLTGVETAPFTTETRTYSRTVTGKAGTCVQEKNTAFVKSGGTTLDSDDATAKLCSGVDLTVSKVSKESLTRGYLWDIQKDSTETGPVMVDPSTGKATTHWKLTLSATGVSDSGWTMSGTITVTNPNDWEDVVLTGLTDSYSGGGTCTIDGWASMTTSDKTIAKSGSKDFDYTCSFGSKPTYSGTNTATATWSSAAAHTPTGSDHYDLAIASSDWTLDAEANKQVSVWDAVTGLGLDPTKVGAASYTWSQGFSVEIPYTVDLGAPVGECQTWTNVGSVRGDDDAELDSDDATVVVCNAAGLTLSKTAAGHYDRTYHWSIDKTVSADPDSDPSSWIDAAIWTGDQYSHVFGYLVTLSQQPWTDSAWSITGTITVTNTNSDAKIPAISSAITDTPNVGADGTCVVDGGTDDGASLVGYQTGDIASGDHVDINYRCTFADKPDYTGGTNDVSGTNVSNSPFSTDVTFTKANSYNETVSVVDDKVTLSTPVELGSVSYDESDSDKTYTWSYTLDHTADAAECQDFTNHVAVYPVLEEVLSLVPVAPLDSAEATATVCPQPGTWVVSKDSNVGDGTVPVNSDITYTLRAHKTGGVNPTNVVLVDDLSPIAPYVDFPTFSAPAGQSVQFSNNVLTWTIDELGGTDATLSFTVHVRSTSFSANLPNLVSSVGSSNCPDATTAAGHDECKTLNGTPAPPVAPVVVVSPPKVHHPAVLPNTGGPNRWAFAAGLALLVAGGALVAGDRRRKHRS